MAPISVQSMCMGDINSGVTVGKVRINTRGTTVYIFQKEGGDGLKIAE